MHKKGLSSIIAIVLTILIAISGIVILSTFILFLFESFGQEEIIGYSNFNPQISIQNDVSSEGLVPILKITVKRAEGKLNMKGVYFVLYDSQEISRSFKQYAVIAEFESRMFEINPGSGFKPSRVCVSIIAESSGKEYIGTAADCRPVTLGEIVEASLFEDFASLPLSNNPRIDQQTISNVSCNPSGCFSSLAALPPELHSSLVAYWKFEESSWSGVAGEIKDSIRGNNGTSVNGAQTTSSGRSGRAASLTGGNHVQIPNYASLNPPEITLAMWGKLTPPVGNPRNVFFDKSFLDSPYTVGYGASIPLTSNTVQFEIGNGTARNIYYAKEVLIDKASWHHYIFTYSKSEGFSLYLDGNLAYHNSTAYGDIFPSGYPLNIGRRSGPGYTYWKGEIDEFMLFNRSISSAEAKEIYRFGSFESVTIDTGVIYDLKFIVNSTGSPIYLEASLDGGLTWCSVNQDGTLRGTACILPALSVKYRATFVSPDTVINGIYLSWSKSPVNACADGFDNDRDGFIDLSDPGCSSASGISEDAGTCESEYKFLWGIGGVGADYVNLTSYPVEKGRVLTLAPHKMPYLKVNTYNSQETLNASLYKVNHTIFINSVSSSEILFSLFRTSDASTLLSDSIPLGMRKTYDIDGDGYYDFALKFNKLEPLNRLNLTVWAVEHYNGGIPQLADMNAHLELVSNSISDTIYNITETGLGILDYEDWGLWWEFTNSTLYGEKSREYILKSYPDASTWTPAQIESKARESYESSAATFFNLTLRKVKELRPNYKWGYYSYPIRSYWAVNDLGKGIGKVNYSDYYRRMNDRAAWLWQESDAIYPSIYQFYRSTNAQEEQNNEVYVRTNVAESLRLAKLHGNKPVYAYTMLVYHDSNKVDGGKPLNDADLNSEIFAPQKEGIQGVIIWGFLPTVQSSTPFDDYFRDNVGPKIASFSKYLCSS